VETVVTAVASSMKKGPLASERIEAVKAFEVKKEKCDVPIWTVKLGATKAEGGTRGRSYTIGGAKGHAVSSVGGAIPNGPRVAMEVYDVISEKYPAILRELYGPALKNPAENGQTLRREIRRGIDRCAPRRHASGTRKSHAGAGVEVVKSVLRAVDVPLIVTGHNYSTGSTT